MVGISVSEALPSPTPMRKNKLFRLYRMIQSTLLLAFGGMLSLQRMRLE